MQVNGNHPFESKKKHIQTKLTLYMSDCEFTALKNIDFIFYIYLGVKSFSKICFLHLTFDLFLGIRHL